MFVPVLDHVAGNMKGRKSEVNDIKLIAILMEYYRNKHRTTGVMALPIELWMGPERDLSIQNSLFCHFFLGLSQIRKQQLELDMEQQTGLYIVTLLI